MVTVSFDRETERQIAVAKPEIVGTPLVGKAELDFEPKVVVLRGPQSKLAEMRIVRTEPVDVTGVVDSFEKQVQLLESDIEGLTVSSSEVKAHVSIVTESVSREIEAIPVFALLPPDSTRTAQIDPPVVSVSLHGGAEPINSLPERSVRVFVECDGIETGTTSRVVVQVHVPPGLNVSATATPPTVGVLLKDATVPLIVTDEPDEPEETE